jgi:formylglycine-generating enzyme required for sulfatase activity
MRLHCFFACLLPGVSLLGADDRQFFDDALQLKTSVHSEAFGSEFYQFRRGCSPQWGFSGGGGVTVRNKPIAAEFDKDGLRFLMSRDTSKGGVLLWPFQKSVEGYLNKKCKWPWMLILISNFSGDFEAISEGDPLACFVRNLRATHAVVDIAFLVPWSDDYLFPPLIDIPSEGSQLQAIAKVDLDGLPLIYKLKYFFPKHFCLHNNTLFSTQPQLVSPAGFIGFYQHSASFADFVRPLVSRDVLRDGPTMLLSSLKSRPNVAETDAVRALLIETLESSAPSFGLPVASGQLGSSVTANFLRFGWSEGAFAGDVYENECGMRFRWCPPGEFWMGSPYAEQRSLTNWLDASDESLHQVSLSHGFWMGEHEVTQGEWRSVMGRSLAEERDSMLAETGRLEAERRRVRDVKEFVVGASGASAENQLGLEAENIPIYWITWEQASEFCERLTKRDREAGKLGYSAHYTLPTEAQWEYACRASTSASVYAGDMVVVGKNNAPILDSIAWYAGNSSVGYEGRGWAANLPEKQYPGGVAGPRTVCGKRPNDWGLYDMLGNVAEWCSDWYGLGGSLPMHNPTGPISGSYRVFRGGGWSSMAAGCRSAFRNWNAPVTREYYVGFRLALVR